MDMISIQVDKPDLTFDDAVRFARALASSYNPDPFLLAWFDRKLNRHSLIGAESSAGCLPNQSKCPTGHRRRRRIEVGRGEYIFIYT